VTLCHYRTALAPAVRAAPQRASRNASLCVTPPRRRPRSPEAGDDEIRVFKAELRQALAHPSELPGHELSDAVEYDDGSAEKLPRRLWRDLYGDEA
jgi:hypothetical protein